MAGRHKPHSGLVIAGTHSSAGKSSVAVGLMRLLKRKGFSVTPFKVGPDYIDPGHHARACGRPSYNLDSWMCPPRYVKSLFRDVAGTGDIAVVEGVMGLFDGAHPKKETGSTAEIAKLLGLPVVLVVDGSAMARSAAALVQGFIQFDPGLRFLGVIANRVNGPGHAKILKDAIEHHAAVKFLGYLPAVKNLEIPSRHLGLHLSHEQEDMLYERWADHIERHVDLSAILKNSGKARNAKPGHTPKTVDRWKQKPSKTSFNVAIAKDEAFQFIYQDTLDRIKSSGGEIKWFSPIHDSRLPDGADFVYLPGGYPELYGKQLSSNDSLLSEVYRFGDSGKTIVAECGGLMYLGKSIIDESGQAHRMVGLFNFSTSLERKKMTLGYRQLSYKPASGPQKRILLKGHEFHFSQLVDNKETARMEQKPRGGNPALRDGFIYKNCFALYSHIYWATSTSWVEFLLGRIGKSPKSK